MSHAADPHAETAEHEAHEAHAVEPSDELAPDEPKTPLWLTALGGGLFLLLAITWLASRSMDAAEVASAAPAPSASAAVAAANPPPSPTPPPALAPPPPPPPTPAAPALSARPDILRMPKRVKAPKP